MSGNNLRNVSNLLIDILGILGIPTATGQGLLHEHSRHREKNAVRILLDELGRGNIDASDVADQNEVVDVIYRYAIAVRDNVALRNLRLLAQVIRNLACQRALYADDFAKYAVCLSSLTREEVIVLGSLHKVKTSALGLLGPDTPASKYWDVLVGGLVPSSFGSEAHVRSIVGGIARTGLVVSEIAISSFGLYSTSPLMEEVYELTDFEAALRE